MRRRIVLCIILAPLMLTVGSVLAQVFTSMVTVGVGSGPLIPGVAAQSAVNVPTIVQSTQARGNPVLSLAYPLNVTSGNILVAALGWFGGTTTTGLSISDTLSSSFGATLVTGGTSGGDWCAIYAAAAASSGADTVTITLPSGGGFNGLLLHEFSNLTKTTDGTASSTTSNQVLSITTGTSGDLVLEVIDSPNSNATVTGTGGWFVPLTNNSSDTGASQWTVQSQLGKIGAGLATSSGSSTQCAVALKHS